MTDPHTEAIAGHHFRLLPVHGGAFLMGSPEVREGTYGDEMPAHEVRVPNFYLGEYPVTQSFWQAVVLDTSQDLASEKLVRSLEPNPAHFKGDELPVEQVSWEDAQLWIYKLNILTKNSRPPGYEYRLPTEAEWEYAARGGQYWEEGYQFAGSDRLKDVGWFGENSDNQTMPVGLKYPNQLGFYDMSGNVSEWCEDDWHSNYYDAPIDGSAWINQPKRSPYRVFRGGDWLIAEQDCRVAFRSRNAPVYRVYDLGFRLALALQSVGRPPAIP